VGRCANSTDQDLLPPSSVGLDNSFVSRPPNMVVKLLFGGGSGRSSTRDAAAASGGNNNNKPSSSFFLGSSGSSTSRTSRAKSSRRAAQHHLGPRKSSGQQPVKATSGIAAPRITVVSTRGAQHNNSNNPATPPTVSSNSTYPGVFDEDDEDDEEDYDDEGGGNNNVSGTSSTMLLLRVRVQHHRYRESVMSANVNDSFEVLTAESQQALTQQQEKQQEKEQHQEQAVRRQLFGSATVDAVVAVAPRTEENSNNNSNKSRAAALEHPVGPHDEHNNAAALDASSNQTTAAMDTTSSSTASSSTSRMYTPKHNVQFVRFSSESAPDPSSILEREHATVLDRVNGRNGGGPAAAARPPPSDGSTSKVAPAASASAATNRTASSGCTGNAPSQARGGQPPANRPAQLRAPANAIAPGSIPLSLPPGKTAANKPPRPPHAPSASTNASNVVCSIPTPAKPFKSHMGSFDTLDTTMSPILKHDPNLSLDTTQTAGNLGIEADDGASNSKNKSSPPGGDPRAGGVSSFVASSTGQWMEQWHELASKVSLAVASCQPRASQLAKKSENLVMDLFYDAGNPLFHCLGKDSCADPKRPLYNEEVTLEFIHLMMTAGVTVLHMQPPHTPPHNPTLDWKGRSVVMILEPGGGGGTGSSSSSTSCVPRLEWTTVAGGTHFEIATSGLHLLEILSVRSRDDEDGDDEFAEEEDLLDDDEGDDETNPSTDDDRPFTSRRGKYLSSRRRAFSTDHGSLASTTVEDEPTGGLDFSCYFTITSTSGDVHVFEAASVQDKNRIIQGLRNVIAWLSYSTVMGDTTASSILFSEGPSRSGPHDEPAELPMLAKQPHRIAMNRTAHVLLDE
jgi:hypothetical protein